MVMYTVRVVGDDVYKRQVKLVFKVNVGERTKTGKTDSTGMVSMWGPWSPSVRIMLDGLVVAERQQWEERAADRYTEVEVSGSPDSAG